MKTKPNPIDMMNTLNKVADDLWKLDNFPNKLAAATIYAASAECIAFTILDCLESKINEICVSVSKKPENVITIVQQEKAKPNKRRTDLDLTINYLDKYTFPSKDELLAILKGIKDSRNKVIHGLIVAPSKNIKIDTEIENIRDGLDKLFKLWFSRNDLQGGRHY